MAHRQIVRSTALVTLGIIISIIFMGISIRHMDWGLVYQELSAIRLYPWFFIGIAIYLCGHVVRGYRTKMLVSRDANLSLITSSSIVIAGYAANNILPARVGELARAGMISERTGIPIPQSLTVVVLERIMDGITIVALCALAAFMTDTSLHDSVPLLVLIFCAGLTGILFVAWAPQRFIAFISKATYRIIPEHHDIILRVTTAIVNGVAYLSQPKNILRIGWTSLLIWLCDAGLFLCIVNVFSISINFWQILLIMTIANLGVFIITSPGYASPGHIGPFHALVMQSLISLGCGQATALAYAITINCAIYIPTMIWASAVLLWYGVTLGLKFSLTRKAKLHTEARTQLSMAHPIGTTFGEALNEKATPFIYMLTEAVLPLNQYSCKTLRLLFHIALISCRGKYEIFPEKYNCFFLSACSASELLCGSDISVHLPACPCPAGFAFSTGGPTGKYR